MSNDCFRFNIFLSFGLLIGQSERIEDVTLASGKIVMDLTF